ncbi:hypothetical protein AW168_40635 [Nocardia brasiliensis]|nr:hypothetical protein AW168_40635 [Nocardia brasiliensis]
MVTRRGVDAREGGGQFRRDAVVVADSAEGDGECVAQRQVHKLAALPRDVARARELMRMRRGLAS